MKLLRTYIHKVRARGFTLIETLVAITLLSVAIVAPMSLTAQSLSAAYYARDQITAFNLAQEGLEAVRAIRDGQILQISKTAASGVNLFGPIPVNQDFRIDSRESDPVKAISTCSSDPNGSCERLQTDGELYGYDPDTSVWLPTNYTRTMHACYIQSSGACNSSPTDEIRLTSTVTWPTSVGQPRSFTIYEDLYRWVNDGAASSST